MFDHLADRPNTLADRDSAERISLALFGPQAVEDPVERRRLADELCSFVVEAAYPRLDPQIRPLLVALWAYGLPTTFSCSGHPIHELRNSEDGGFNLPHVLFRFSAHGKRRASYYEEQLTDLVERFNSGRPAEKQIALLSTDLVGWPLQIGPPADEEEMISLAHAALGHHYTEEMDEGLRPDWPSYSRYIALNQEERETLFDRYIAEAQELFSELTTFILEGR